MAKAGLDDPKWSLRFGGYYTIDQDGQVQIQINGISALLDIEDTLDLEYETTVFRLDGHYRFTPEHRIEVSAYKLDSHGSKVLDESLLFPGGSTVDIGATLDSELDIDTYRFNYTYSFYHSDQVEVGISGGLHVTGMNGELEASGSINSNPGQYEVAGSSVTAPLPVIGVRFEYAATDHITIEFMYDLFFLEYDDYQGRYTDSQWIVEYTFDSGLGLGLGIDSTEFNVEADDDNDVELNFDTSFLGLTAFLSYSF